MYDPDTSRIINMLLMLDGVTPANQVFFDAYIAGLQARLRKKLVRSYGEDFVAAHIDGDTSVYSDLLKIESIAQQVFAPSAQAQPVISLPAGFSSSS